MLWKSALVLANIIAFASAFDSWQFLTRIKRDTVGALDIVTNNAQPIHASVKLENGPASGGTATGNAASGPTASVLAPVTKPPSKALSDALENTRTLLRSLRNTNRVVALIVLMISMCIEFYPFIKQFIFQVYTFLGYE